MFKILKSRIQLFRDVFRRWIGIFLFDKKTCFSEKKIKNILFVRWDAKIGDSIVSSFCFRELNCSSDITVNVITTKSLAGIMGSWGCINRFFTIKKRPSYVELYQLSKKVGDVDLVVHFSKKMKMKDLFFLRMVNANFVAGLDDEIKLVNIKLGEVTRGHHFSFKFEQVLRYIGLNNFNNNYLIPENDLERERDISRFVCDKTPYIVFNPYGSGSSRQFTYENICKILSIINNIDSSVGVLILITPDKKQEAEKIILSNNNSFFYSKTNSILDSISLMKHACKVITVDTAITHISKGLNKNTFCFYNPDYENFSEWGYNEMHNFFAKEIYPPNINFLDYDDLRKELSYFIREN